MNFPQNHNRANPYADNYEMDIRVKKISIFSNGRGRRNVVLRLKSVLSRVLMRSRKKDFFFFIYFISVRIRKYIFDTVSNTRRLLFVRDLHAPVRSIHMSPFRVASHIRGRAYDTTLRVRRPSPKIKKKIKIGNLDGKQNKHAALS